MEAEKRLEKLLDITGGAYVQIVLDANSQISYQGQAILRGLKS